MSHSEHPDTTSLPDSMAERVLARAAQLDGAYSEGRPVPQMREAAVEAGIAPQAFDAALREVTAADTPVSTRPRVPWWIRVCLFGVVDRRAAMAFYWLFTTMILLAPALAVGLPARVGSGVRVGVGLLVIGYGLFSLWSTSRAIRWTDRHGWESLP